MTRARLTEKAEAYLHRLCTEHVDRRVGSPGNRAATDFFSDTAAGFGFGVDCPTFDCLDWCQGGAHLVAGGTPFEAFVSPYSVGGFARAPLAVVSTVEELEAAQVGDTILLLRQAIAREPLMPKDFPFYNPEEHQHIIKLLETKHPRAIIGATSRHPEMAGAVYPFPLIEDGDFDVPSVYLTEEEGARLAEHSGEVVSLDIRALRNPARACNVVARKGVDPRRRTVLFAHIDTKGGTPGALDNGGGVVVLLLLAELLKDYDGALGVELVALNGEDTYSAPGERQFLRDNAGRFEEIVLGVNLDGAGYREGRTAYSLYDCPPDVARAIDEAFSPREGLVEGERWYQGDHGLFLMNEVPALAITSERLREVLSRVAHTPRDRPKMVDVGKLVDVAAALREVVARVAHRDL